MCLLKLREHHCELFAFLCIIRTRPGRYVDHFVVTLNDFTSSCVCLSFFLFIFYIFPAQPNVTFVESVHQSLTSRNVTKKREHEPRKYKHASWHCAPSDYISSVSVFVIIIIRLAHYDRISLYIYLSFLKLIFVVDKFYG